MQKHAHSFVSPAANGPVSTATCACGVTQLRSNGWQGDYTSDEWATHTKRGRASTKTKTKTKPLHAMPKLVFGKAEKGIA